MSFFRNIILLASFSAVCFTGFSQENNESQFLYSIAVKQTFTAWSECSNATPRFEKAELVMRLRNNPEMPRTIVREELGSMKHFDGGFRGSSDFSKRPLNLQSIDSIAVATWVSEIRNDTKQEYGLKPELWHAGVNEPVSRSASDPCSNNANWSGNREGYTVSTTVIVDDPVMIAGLQQEPYDAESEYIVLEFDNFYWEGIDHEVVLEFKVNDGVHGWEALNEIKVRPGKKAYIAYSRLAGRKDDPTSKYYDWLGKIVGFRVKKILINGMTSYGNSEEAAFYTSGPKFRVLEVRNPWCVDKPVIMVELHDHTDASLFDLENIEWLAQNEIKQRVECKHKHIGGNVYQLVPINADEAGLFKTGGEWFLQLQLPGEENEGFEFHVETFTIPGSSDQIGVLQTDEIYPASDPQFHLLSKTTPYAIINITDSGNRLPYAIYKETNQGNLFVDSLKSKPSDFNALPIEEQNAIYNNFVTRYRFMEKGRRNTNWEKFFNLKFNAWFFDNLRPIKTDIASTTGISTCSSSFDDVRLIVMSDNAKYLGSAYYYNLTNYVKSGSLFQLSYESLQMSERYHAFWKNNAKSDVFSFDENTVSSGYNSSSPGTWLKIDNAGNCQSKFHTYDYTSVHTGTVNSYHLVNYNGCSIVGKDASENFHLIGTLGAAFGVNEDLPNYFDGIIDATGTKCAYRNEARNKLYFYEWPGSIRSWSGSQITNIRYINTTAFPNYIIYETASGDRYQQYLLDESNKQEVADRYFTTESLYINWYNDYLAEQWQQFLANNYGHRLYNHTMVNPASDETYFLIDKDGCKVEFPVNVKVPEQPQFTVVTKINPSTNCSSDGQLTLMCKTANLLPLSCGSGTITSTTIPLTVKELGWSDNIEFYNSELGLTFSYPVAFSGNPDGIQSLTPSSQTCGSNPDGSITVNFAPNSTSHKTYKLTNIQGVLLASYTTTANKHTFIGLQRNKGYKVSVDVDMCNIPWNQVVTIKDEIFTIDIKKTDSEIIGENGSAILTITNIPIGISWKGTDFPAGVTTKTYSLGEHLIEATHTRNGNTCSTKKAFEILEPSIQADIEILKEDNNIIVSKSNITFNSLVKSGKLVIKDTSNKSYEFGASLSSEKEYVIYFEYNGKQKEIYRFSSANFSDLNIPHYVQTTGKNCPDAEITAIIKLGTPEQPVTLDPSLTLKANFEGVYTESLETTTKQSLLHYSLQTIKENTTDISTSSLNITRIVQMSYEKEMPQTIPVSASARLLDITCHSENNGQISIAEASGGSGEYEWKRENDVTWVGVLDTITVSPGSYKIYLRDSGNKCDPVLIDNVDIAEPAPLVVTDTCSIHPICADGTGSISMTVTGGNGYYVFILSTSSGEELEVKSYEEYLVGFSEEKEFPEIVTIVFPNLTHGDYRITATDPLGCSDSKDFTLEAYLNPVIEDKDIKVDDVRCYNEKNGSIRIDSVSRNNVDFLYLYNDESILLKKLQWPAQKFEGLISASYKVMVRDSNGCASAPVPVIVYQPDSMIFSLKSILPVREKGSSTGRIDAQVTGGNRNSRMTALLTSDNNNFLDTLFNKGGHSFEFKTLPAGTYNISVSDAKECAVTRENLVVEEPDDTLAIKVLWVKDALCKAQVGGFSIEGTGGWGKYSYKNAHENGANTDFVPKSTFEDLYAGTYFVTVRDSMGATATKPIEINEPGFLSTQVVDSILPTCENNGVLNVKVLGGTLPYRLAFDGSSDTTQIDSPLTSPFSFKNRSAGEYLLTTIDDNGCRYEYSSSISSSNLLSINDFELIAPSEKFALDGQIKAIVTGGKGPLTYEWVNRTRQDISVPSDGAEITGINSGVYAIEVREASGCSITEDVYLSDVTDEILMIKEIGHETSYNNKNGYALLLSSLSRIDSVEVYYPNGVVEILTGDKTSIVGGVDSLANLSGGKYLVRAFGFDKVEVAEFKIEPYNEFFIDAIVVRHVKVKGETSGSATVSLKGGAAPFKYTWAAVSGSLADATIDTVSAVATGLRAGTYHLEVTDRYGNKLDKEFEVLQPDAKLTLEIEERYNQSCKDNKDAWVQVKTGGGWPNYQYRHAHSTDYQNQRSWFNLEIGEHKFYTVDQRGVVDSVSVTITEPDYLRASVAMIDSIHCYGEANGKIYFDIEGGTGPYSFALLEPDPFWRNTTELKNYDQETHIHYIHDGLDVGERIYQFTDRNNCYAIDTLKVFIPQPDPLDFSKFDVTHTTCNTDNGMIVAAMKGGTLPYNYQWTDNLGEIISTSATATDLKQNIHYKIDVQDKYHCYQTKTQRISASTNPLIKEIVTQPVLCFGDSNGLAEITEVTAAEPYAPYGFIWSNGGEGESTQGLLTGRHSVVMRDTNQCETTKYFEVGTPRKLDLSVQSLKNAHCYGYNDGHIEISAFGGVGDYAYLWSSGDTTQRADNLTRGEYRLALTDSNNCLYEEKFFIDEPPMEVVDVGDDFTMCPGNFMVIDGHSFAAHEWQREGEILSEERYFTVDTEGEYALMVTNDRGCFAYDTLSVTIGNDALKADFLMSSEAFLNDTILLFELSNLPLDSLSWTYPDHLFSNETPEGADDYILHLKTLAEGMYNIALYAYSGGCFSKQVKQIEIKDGDREEDDELLGYRDPLIKHFVVSPNPNDGRFNVKVELREAADIHLAVFSISHGVKLDERSRSGLDTYSESFVLGSLNSGVYVVILTAEKERRQLKIIIE